MAPPVWTLMLLVGTAWGQGHMPAPAWREKPLDLKPAIDSSKDSTLLSRCDFEDESKPFCDWTQVSADDGDWIRASGPSKTGTTGPLGGYPSGEGNYLHMVSKAFRRGGVARLRSPYLWVQGPLCVRFVYHMFGLSWGAQLRLLLLSSTQGQRPSVLWKHRNTQSPSWMPTAVTVPAGFALPTQLMFEGMRGNTAYLDIALDAISIHRGSCSRVCMMQMCSFDTPNDLCGWSWIPTATGAKWIQKKGQSGKPGMGPDDDFSSPGNGYYMLLDPRNARPRQKSVFLSPLSHSSGCLSLSFHYTLWGQSPGAALHVYASVLGSIRRHTLFSGQPKPNWQPVSVNYTGQGQIQFTVVGVFGKIPEPAVAVDDISIAPCGESFPQCDFEDDDHPFCDWTQKSQDGGHWIRGHRNVPLQSTDFPRGSHYIYLQSDKFSQAGQSVILVSRPFCAPGDICVEFAYHMYGLGEGTTLKFLLGSPAGSTPITLWSRVGSQSPDWQNASITISSGHQQPMQLIFKATRGSSTAFVVAIDFILVSHGICRAQVPPVPPDKSPVSPTGPSETTGLAEKPTIPTETTTVPTEAPAFSTETTMVPTEQPTISTETTTVPTETTTVPTEQPTIPTEVPTEEPAISTETTTVPTEQPTIPTETTTIPTEIPTVPTETTTVPTETTTVPTEQPTVPTETTTIPTEKPTVHTETTAVPTEITTVPTEKPTVDTETTTVPIEKPAVHTETTVPTEKPTVHTEKPTALTEETTIPTKEPTVPTEKPTTPIKESTSVTREPTTTVTPHPSTVLVHTVPALLGMVPQHVPNTSMTSATLGITTTPGPATESCPLNAHYESCACPASCKNPRPSCGLLCQAGCVCNPGFLFSDNGCINASSCDCFYNNYNYKTGAEWFSPNCTEYCHCWPGNQIECQSSQCGARTMCQLKNGQYGCYSYGFGTCLVYGDPHYVTFDGRHFGFMGRCTYILTQPCGNSTDPFFRVTAVKDGWEQQGMSYLNKVYVTLPETTVTLLKGRRTLVGSQQVTLPAIPSKGVFLAASGRFVELHTEFGLWVRWDGDQQLFVSVARTYSSKLCGLCGNYDGDMSNDHLKPDGQPARDEEELGESWQMAEDEDRECQKSQASSPSCDSALQSNMSGPGFCGRLVDSRGPFEACLFHLKATSFFDNCMFDMCNFQGLQQMLCAHMSAMTTSCQDAGYPMKPWREPHFCPLACPPNSKYSLCARPCPDTCHSAFSGMFCPDRCVEGCECNPGFVLSGLNCVPQSQCGCLDSNGSYFKVGEKWHKPGCRQLCFCKDNNRIRCYSWKCKAQEICDYQDGIYGCHALGAATCTASGDPHYLTFDGALHHFMGTCTYVLTKPCWTKLPQNYFVVSTSNENRGGILEASFVKAVHVQIFGLKISLLKGRKVMLNGHRVALPVWPLKGLVTLRLSGIFVVLYTTIGLLVRYDGVHLVEVTVPSSYAGQLCGLCGNYNNNSLDDNLRPDKKPTENSIQLGASWKLPESSEPGCFLMEGRPSGCQEGKMTDTWNKNCAILTDPQGPFSQCHEVVPPQASLASCVRGQCGTKGDTTALCHSLQAYASLCTQAGQAPVWRNSTFCPLKCPPGSSYSPCVRPCPATCLSLVAPRDCPASLPCAEGCECQKGHILSGTSCVPFSQCGCIDPKGFYHLVGESWYTESTCSWLCTCSIHNNITCFQTTCKPNQMCWSLDGVLRCRVSGRGVCRVSGDARYVSFDGSEHFIRGTCAHVLMKVCHPNMNMPFFKISAKNKKLVGRPKSFHLHQVYIDIYNSQIILQNNHHVLINGKQVTLPESSQIPGVSILSRGIHTIVKFKLGARVTFDGRHLLEIELPTGYYGKVCGVCGNFNGEEDDELMMPSDELAWNDQEFVKSWKDKDIDPNCQGDNLPEDLSGNCREADFYRAREKCEAALEAPAWSQCASHLVLKPFLVSCANTLCEFGGLNHALCQALQAFGSTCESQGLKPPLWRNSSFCPLECPPHSSYTNCLPPCSPSCWDLDGRCEGVKVPSTCAEGCICQPGYVLNEDKCVPRSQCGCEDAQGGLIPPGKTWISSGCTDSCVCMGGTIQCRAFRCPSGSHCQPSSDHSNSNCAADKSEQCSVFGDPHYHTFDHLSYHFMGRMTYILIKTVDVLPEGVERLLVKGRNKMHEPWSPIILNEVIIIVYGYKVQLQTGLGLVVNDQKMAIPYRPNEHLWVTLRGQRLYLVTDFELVVSFDGRRNAVISLPSTYQGLVRGLCGNYDKNHKNELMLPSGVVTHNLNTFGNSWEVKTEDSVLRFPRAIPEEEEGGGGAVASFHVAACSPEQLALINSTQACRVLVDPLGPFAACHQTVAPEPFQEHCVLDLCSAGDPREQEEMRCQVLSAYAILCQEAGVALASWRNHTRCAMACPANTVYQSCMTPCPASCADLADPRDCEGPCVEGCASIPGYIYSGTQSLPLAHCGCTSNGIYYQRGDSFVTEDCSQRCTCAHAGILLCKPFSCSVGETCTLGNLTRGCFRESPCLRNPCQNDGRCQEQGASFTCQCELGYGGDLCTEPRDLPPPEMSEASRSVAVLLGMLVPAVVVVLAATRECVYRVRRRWREKIQSQNRGRGARADTGVVPECTFKVTQF
nr:zonadhesin isoform X3 [Microcebus murinus]